MDSTVTCPDPEQLDDLLANRLSAVAAEQVRQHLRDCVRCRGRLTSQPGEGERYPFLSPPRAAGELGWIDSFRVLGVLGTGGMAVVFDAEDTRLGRPIALKVLRPDISSDDLRARFLREAQLLASVSHEHIVTVFQVGEVNGIPFIAMERLEGMTLAERLRQDRWLPLGEALDVAAQVAEGLTVAHQHGLVHRDVKPANIWLETRHGRMHRVKLIDFGIARRQDDSSQLTLAGQVLGTPIYMAPEQGMGQAVDGRADLYSLGCVLYQMLTGQPPLGGDHEALALLQEVVGGRVTVVRDRALQIPPPVAGLLQALLQERPEQRPATAGVVAETLRRLERETQLNGAATAAAHIPPAIRRQVRRASRASIFLGVLAVAAAVVVGLVAAWYKLQSHGPAAPVTPAKLRIGILHSLNGSTKDQERPILHALQLAIEEINRGGGVLKRQLDEREKDGASDEDKFADMAQKLIAEDGVEALFGCWASSSRRRVAKVCEDHDRLLFYSASTEGLETSAAVVSLGGTPNQTAVPLVEWFYGQGKRRFYFLGGETVYSHALHVILEHKINDLQASVAGQSFVTPKASDIAGAIAKIKAAQPDVILNTIVGHTNVAVLRELRLAGIQPTTIPSAWFAVSKSELNQFPIDGLAGDYSVACYFGSLQSPQNKEFLERFRKHYGDNEPVNDDMQTAYASVYLWRDAVEKAGTTETSKVRKALRGLVVQAPVGPIRIDPTTQYADRTAYIGQIAATKPLASFRIVWNSPEPLRPQPYPNWRSPDEWHTFLDGLYEKWGQRWEQRR